MKLIDEAQRSRLAGGLTGLLADTYLLHHSTQACHWNVDGPWFGALHRIFEEQYEEMARAIDEIAKRVRSLGFYTPATLAELTRRSRIRQPADLRDPESMLDHLIEAHMQVVHRVNEVRGEAEALLDEATTDLLVERLRAHERTLWMLRSQAGRASTDLTQAEKKLQEAI
jgi:starvation-inducible DNA-binding protein